MALHFLANCDVRLGDGVINSRELLQLNDRHSRHSRHGRPARARRRPTAGQNAFAMLKVHHAPQDADKAVFKDIAPKSSKISALPTR